MNSIYVLVLKWGMMGSGVLVWIFFFNHSMTSFYHEHTYLSIMGDFLYDVFDYSLCFILSILSFRGIFLIISSKLYIDFLGAIIFLIFKLIFAFCFLVPTPIYNIMLLCYGYSLLTLQKN